MLDYKQQNRDAIHGSVFNRDVVNVSAEVVKVPTKNASI
jgi:succinylarginine dihydrolase